MALSFDQQLRPPHLLNSSVQWRARRRHFGHATESGHRFRLPSWNRRRKRSRQHGRSREGPFFLQGSLWLREGSSFIGRGERESSRRRRGSAPAETQYSNMNSQKINTW